MFQGSSNINMDAKGRINIPAKYRDGLVTACENRVVITASTQDRCAALYPEPEWLKLRPQIEALSSYGQSVRAKRLLLGLACELEIDGNGRISIPETLREYGEFDKKLVLVGQGKKFEIWDEKRWSALFEDNGGDIPDELLNLPL